MSLKTYTKKSKETTVLLILGKKQPPVYTHPQYSFDLLQADVSNSAASWKSVAARKTRQE